MTLETNRRSVMYVPPALRAARQLVYEAGARSSGGLIELGQVAQITMGQSPHGSTCSPEPHGDPLLNGPTEFGAVNPTPVQWTTAAKQLARQGDLLFCVRGATAGRTNWADRRYAVGRGLAAIRGKSHVGDTVFIYHMLRNRRDALASRARGSTFMNLGKDTITGIQIPKIELALQEALGRFLCAVEAGDMNLGEWENRFSGTPFSHLPELVSRIDALARRAEEARGLRRAAVKEAEAVYSYALKNCFAEYAQECTSIGEVFRVSTGGTPSRQDPSFWNGKVKWVSSGEVAFSRITDTMEKITELGVKQSSAKVCPPNTVLIAMIGQGKTRGQSAILDCYAATNQNVAAIHVYETQHLPEYVFWWLRSRYLESRSSETGTAQPALNGHRVRQMPIPLPVPNEQRRVVTYLDGLQAKVDELRRLQAETQKELDALMPSILAKAFAGEL